MTENKVKLLEAKYLVPFILITFCFALWGFANDVTLGVNRLVTQRLRVCRIEYDADQPVCRELVTHFE